MANKIQLKRSAVAGKTPTTTDLDLGELAINTRDGKLYTKTSDGTTETVVQLSVDSTVVKTTDSGTVTSAMLADGTIVNGDINASAAIAGTKISPDFGAQTVTTTGVISAAAGAAATPSIAFNGDPNTGFYSPGADQLALSTGGSGQLFVDASGNVGIGTPSPATRLEVSRVGAAWTGAAPLAGSALFIHNGNNSSSTAAHIQISAGSASSSLINFGDEASASRGRITYDHSSDALFFHSAGGERVRIDSSGRLGVGTSAPAAPLHVAASSNTILRLEDTTGSYCDFNYNDSGTASALVISADAGNTGADTAIRFNVDNTERLRITSTGLVGIGTSIPSKIVNAKSSTQYDGFLLSNASNTVVEIIGFSAANDNGSVLLRNGGAANVQLLASGTSYFNGGNVGIGTSAPEQELHVSGSGNNLAIFQSTSNTVCRILLRNTGATTDQVQIGSSSGDLNMFTGSAERLRIDSSGRLLVGTSTALNVGGNAGFEGLQLGSTSSASSVSLSRWAANANSSLITFAKSRGAAVGTNAAVVAEDDLGVIVFSGDHGAGFAEGARIRADVESGSISASSMPTRLSFLTSAGGSVTPTERMRIDSAGRVGIASTAPAATAHVGGSAIISNVNLASATYDSVSFSVASQENTPTSLFFSPDGRKMFTAGTTSDSVHEYTLSTPWNVSTASYVTAFSVSGQDGQPNELYFRNDGKKFYVAGQNNDVVYQYSLGTPWSIATASYDSVSFSVATEETGLSGLTFKSDGLAFYVVGTVNDTIYRYNLSTAWDVSTAALASSFSIAAQENTPSSLSFTADGSRLFVIGASGDDINIYNLTTPWDVTTASFVTVFSIAAQETNALSLFVQPSGTKFYIVGSTNDTVYQYTIPSATIDLTGTTNINGSAEVAQDLTVRGGVGFYGTAAIAQPSGTGETTGFTAGTGTAVNDASTFTGNLGTTAYRINDVVKALKQLGLLAL